MFKVGTEYFIQVFWHDREEPLEVCTDKCWEFLQEYMKLCPYPIFPYKASNTRGLHDSIDKEFVKKLLKKYVPHD